jgi:hypothetical protein
MTVDFSEYRRLLSIMWHQGYPLEFRIEAAAGALAFEHQLQEAISASPNVIEFGRGKFLVGMSRYLRKARREAMGLH